MLTSFFEKPISIYKSYRLMCFSLLLAMAIGVLLSALVPPFQSPDEHAHFTRAYLLSKGRIAMQTPEGESTGGNVDKGLGTFMGAYSHLAFDFNSKVSREVKENAETIRWAGEEQFRSNPGINYYFPFIYLPQTVGLLIGQWSDLSVEQTYQLARYIAFFSSIVVVAIAFSMAGINAYTLALFFTPLVVFQLISTSQDGFAIALLTLTLSLFSKITHHPEKALNRHYFYWMLVVILLLVTSRINFLPLLILPFAVVALTTKSKKDYLYGVGITVLALGWILYALNTTVDNRVNIGAPTKEIIIHYVTHPLDFITVLYNTLTSKSLLNFYAASFVGVLGWLDAPMNPRFVTLFLLILAGIFLFSIQWKELKREILTRAILIVVAISSFILTFFLLLITWTEHPATTVQGVQGRYLWGAAIILAYGLTTPLTRLSKIKRAICIGGIILIASITLLKMPDLLIDRYYLRNGLSTNVSVKNNFEEVSANLQKMDSNAKGVGGFIDSASLVEGGIKMEGWGFFSTEEKQFFSNLDDVIAITYTTKVRQDVANAHKNDSLRYSGFILFVPGVTVEDVKELCLYTDDPVFGTKRILPGKKDMLYQCAN